MKIETDKENQKIKAARKAALKKKEYVPKPKTGKLFHVLLEIVVHNKAGKRTSESRVQLMDFPTLLQWVKNASKLGFAFGFLHDASVFLNDKQTDEIVNSLKSYAREVNIDNFEYGVTSLCKDKTLFLNKKLIGFHTKKAAHLAKIKESKSKPADYLD